MGYQIIKQDEGVYAVFSSYDDTIVVSDASAEDIVDWFTYDQVKQAIDNTGERIARILADLAQGHPELAYRQFAMTWEQAQQKDRENDGAYSRGVFGEPSLRDIRYVVLDTSDADHLRASVAKLHPANQAALLTALTSLLRKDNDTWPTTTPSDPGPSCPSPRGRSSPPG